MCRAVFSKFKACINTPKVNVFRPDRDAINVICNSLQLDREHSDISDIIRQLHEVVEEVINVEQTFEALLRKARELDQEENRAVREGLTDASLAIFDLLKKPELKPGEIKRIKAVSTELLEVVKRELAKIHHWRDKEAARDTIQNIILNFLYNDQTGLPESSYATEEVSTLTTKVYSHIYRAYPTIPSPFYAEAVV